MINESMEPWWNDTDKVKVTKSEKNLFQCHFIHHKSHMDWASTVGGGANNCLSHGLPPYITQVTFILFLESCGHCNLACFL
jgi:hypothetical protein